MFLKKYELTAAKPLEIALFSQLFLEKYLVPRPREGKYFILKNHFWGQNTFFIVVKTGL